MMRRVGVLLLTLLVMGWTLSVTRAQDALTQNFTAKDGSYSFNYPSGWQVIDAEGRLLVQTDNAQVVGVFFEYLAKSGSLKDAVTQALTDNLGQGAAGSKLSFKDTQVGNYPAVQFEFSAGGIMLTGDALDTGNGKAFVGIVYSMADVTTTFGPTFDAVMASFKLGAGGSAPAAVTAPVAVATASATAEATATTTIETETFTASDGSYTITSPSGWDWFEDASTGPGAATLYYSDGKVFTITGNIQILPNPQNLTAAAFMEDLAAKNGGTTEKLKPEQLDLNGRDALHITVSSSPSERDYIIAIPDHVVLMSVSTAVENLEAQNASIMAMLASIVGARDVDQSTAAFDAEYAALAPDTAAATAEPTTEATAAPTEDAQAETKLVTATAGKYTVSARLPTTPGVTVRDFSRDSAEIAMTGLSTVGFDVDIQFPPSVSSGTTAKTMLESKLNYAKGPINEFQVDGREAARLDAENRDPSEYVYMIVKTAAGDYVDVEFTVLISRKEEVEPAMLALLTSVTTGDPNAQPTAQPTTDNSAPPTTEAGGAASPACTVTANGTANLRSGPGTSFAKAGSLAAGASQSVTGQATGSDGKIWYQLDSGSYVRSDLVKADGDCASVPTVSP